MSCENIPTIITTVVASTIAIVSEILPFFTDVEGNGIVDTILKALRKKFPLSSEQRTVTIREPESSTIPEIETSTV